MKISKAQRQRINGLSAEAVKAQRAAVEALAAELDRRRQKEPPFEWDASVLAELALQPLELAWDPDVLAALAEPIDLSGLLAESPRPVYIPIDED